MSLSVWLGVRGRYATFLVALVEQAFFFTVVTSLYFVAVRALYQWFAPGPVRVGWETFVNPPAWFAGLPPWMWLLQGAGYLLLITIYWAPGREEANSMEVTAFAVLLGLAVIGALGWLQVSRNLLGDVLRKHGEAAAPVAVRLLGILSASCVFVLGNRLVSSLASRTNRRAWIWCLAVLLVIAIGVSWAAILHAAGYWYLAAVAAGWIPIAGILASLPPCVRHADGI